MIVSNLGIRATGTSPYLARLKLAGSLFWAVLMLVTNTDLKIVLSDVEIIPGDTDPD